MNLVLRPGSGGDKVLAPPLFSDSSDVRGEVQDQCNEWTYQRAWQHRVAIQAPSQTGLLPLPTPPLYCLFTFARQADMHILTWLWNIEILPGESLCFLPVLPPRSCPLPILEAERAANSHPKQTVSGSSHYVSTEPTASHSKSRDP